MRKLRGFLQVRLSASSRADRYAVKMTVAVRLRQLPWRAASALEATNVSMPLYRTADVSDRRSNKQNEQGRQRKQTANTAAHACSHALRSNPTYNLPFMHMSSLYIPVDDRKRRNCWNTKTTYPFEYDIVRCRGRKARFSKCGSTTSSDQQNQATSMYRQMLEKF